MCVVDVRVDVRVEMWGVAAWSSDKKEQEGGDGCREGNEILEL